MLRLLNATTFQLESFSEDDTSGIPRYVTLSHTWGDEEVTFESLNSDDFCNLAGWRKIKYSCQQATHDGFNYAWIDKSSSAELNEAINSMFKIYEKSQLCYAYLDDVDMHSSSSWSMQFENCKWFTRGWTLQELLAPPDLVFYDCNWTCMGSRSDLALKISQASGIDCQVIKEPSIRMSQNSVACRMSWASQRATTKVEDIAYCLLGIFNVHMPLIYGEGKNAFIRLQLEIIRTTHDHSIFAWGLHTDEIKLPDLNTAVGSEELLSILATSPKQFQSCRKLLAYRSNSAEPYSFTNMGLQITLPIVTLTEMQDRKLSFAVLSCGIYYGDKKDILEPFGDQGLCVGVFLWSFLGGGNIYYRCKDIPPSVLRIEDIFDAKPAKILIKTIKTTDIVETQAINNVSCPVIILLSETTSNNYYDFDQPEIISPTEIKWEVCDHYHIIRPSSKISSSRYAWFMTRQRLKSLFSNPSKHCTIMTLVMVNESGNWRYCKRGLREILQDDPDEDQTNEEWVVWAAKNRNYAKNFNKFQQGAEGSWGNFQPGDEEGWVALKTFPKLSIRAKFEETSIHCYNFFRLEWEIK